MKSKKSILIILSILVIASLVVFSSCGKDDTDAIPTNAEPAPTQEPVTTPEPTPEPTPKPELHFDEFVEQYESSNDIDLNTSLYMYHYEFFEEIYMQNYTGTDAINDMEVTSEENKPLLDEYINKYLADLHDACDFDDAVNEFIQSNPDVDISQELTPLFNYILEQGIDPIYLQDVGCSNQYAKSFIKWYQSGGTYNPYEIEGGYTVGEGIHAEISTEEEWEAVVREAEEFQRQSQEAAAAAHADLARSEAQARADGTPYGYGNNF